MIKLKKKFNFRNDTKEKKIIKIMRIKTDIGEN